MHARVRVCMRACAAYMGVCVSRMRVCECVVGVYVMFGLYAMRVMPDACMQCM